MKKNKLFFKNLKNLGISITLYSTFCNILSKIKMCSNSMLVLKYKMISKWMYKKFPQSFDKIEEKNIDSRIPKNVFVFWWQGYDQAPELVKRCIDSIKKRFSFCDVIVIDKENFSKYVFINDYILNLLITGKITITSFSDVLRFNLINQNGGLWIDATCFISSDFDENDFNVDFLSFNGSFDIWPWTDFFLGGPKNNIVSRCMVDFFDNYLKTFDYFFTYLVVDSAILCCYRNNIYCNEILKKIKKNDKSIFIMNDELLDKEFNESEYNKLCSKTKVHKLSYKQEHSKYKNGKLTLYGALIEGLI